MPSEPVAALFPQWPALLRADGRAQLVARRVQLRRCLVIAHAVSLGIQLRAVQSRVQAGRCLRQRYQQAGAAALRHGNAGKRSSRAKPEQLRERVLSLVRSEYGGGQRAGLGPPLAAEHLQSDHGLVVGVSTLRARGSTPLLLLPLPASE